MSATKTEAEAVKIEPQQAAQPAGSPRKRRRRAPTTGAADDCFTCQERHTKCDRRRPYCSLCLDQGKDCSGYKTALTWGVGVASRGKLRGLSLPIPKSKRAAQSIDEEQDNKADGPKKLAKLGPTRRASDSRNGAHLRCPASLATTGNIGTSTTYNFVSMDPNSSAGTTSPSPMLPPPNLEWRAPPSLFQGRGSQQARRRPRRHTLQPLSVPTIHPTRDYGVMPMTASVVGGYGGHHDFGLSSQISPMVPSFTGYGIISPTYKEFTSQSMVQSPCENNFFTSHETLGWPRDNMSSNLASNHSGQNYPQQDTFFGDLMATANPTDSMLPTQQTFPPHDLSVTSASDTTSMTVGSKYPVYASHSSALVADDVRDHTSSLVPRSLPSLSIGNTPKLQYLIDYYDKVISPVIVAFDGPTNPYRSHILSLAVESETLQHATLR